MNPAMILLKCNVIVPGVYYYQLDVTDFGAIESTAETIRREHGDPTVLINNAGVGEHNL
jgi:NAD(P)-dependent dehydrogenase (short-subunit alcohol dehydrogenase family)